MKESPSIFYASICQDRLSEVSQNYPTVLENLHPDQAVIVDGGSLDGTAEFLLSLESSYPNIRTLYRKFDGDFVSQRKVYLDEIEEIASEGDVLLVSDSDEYFSVNLLKDIREIARWVYEQDANLIRVRAWDEEYDRNGNVTSSFLNNWYKPLIAIWEPGGFYVGAGGKPIHEELFFPSGRRFMILDDNSGKYYYRHRKQAGSQYEGALRNFYISGLDPSGFSAHNEWLEFKQLLQKQSCSDWSSVLEYFKRGQINDRIKEWLVSNRNHRHCEISNSFKAYFILYHPDEIPEGLKNIYEGEIQKLHGETRSAANS